MGYSTQEIGKWYDYVPTYTGFSVDPILVSARYTLNGKLCTVRWRHSTGTSNATTLTITLPFAARTLTNDFQFAPVFAFNNGASLTTPGLIATASGSNIANVYTNMANAAWTASSTKFFSGTLTYEID